MASEQEIRDALSSVLVPQAARSVTDLNLVRSIQVGDGKVKVTLASTALSDGAKEWVASHARSAIEGMPGVKEASLDFVEAAPQEINRIRHSVAVMSGKGGVGKSLVTALLAIALNRQGHKVGILDADITGPSIPKMFGINSHPGGSPSGILPVQSESGVSVMSINLLLPAEDEAVIWRGPLIAKAIQQFWQEVLWGELDCLMVDLPPGTADAPLTVMQSIPLSGVVIALTPQDLTAMVVRKAVKMAKTMNIPVLGVVENMSYFVVPETDKRIEIFGKSRGAEMAEVAGAPLLGQLPLDPELARLCDEGCIERYASEAFDGLARSFVDTLMNGKGQT
ncbi:MAG: ATP-binding protein [Chloroflexi bacterium]|nr:MAG: ATP-binding protein [Chloroflexota bacterium]RLC94332.1 MAG: ATP-binding protein [Chloroflexota bacterium]